MIPIYLCDDEPIWLERLNKAVIDYQIKSDWEITVEYQTTSPEQFLHFLTKRTPKNGIYFLDVDLKTSINGMELAKEIRRLDPQASLIFITTHDEMVMETFRLKLEALDYIIKDSSPLAEKIYLCLSHLEGVYCSTESQTSGSITIRADGSYHTISVQDIYYIETIKNTHKVRIYLQNAMYHITESVTALQKRLGPDFYHCHKAYLVNIHHIAELDIETHNIILDNGSICPCSTREWRNIVKKYKSLHV